MSVRCVAGNHFCRILCNETSEYSAVGALLGPPISGWLIGADSGSYVHPQIFAGIMLAFGSVLLVGNYAYLSSSLSNQSRITPQIIPRNDLASRDARAVV
jgi:hypothetical protein